MSTLSTFEERALLTMLQGEVGRLLAESETIAQVMQGCVQALVERIDAAFARIWTF